MEIINVWFTISLAANKQVSKPSKIKPKQLFQRLMVDFYVNGKSIDKNNLHNCSLSRAYIV